MFFKLILFPPILQNALLKLIKIAGGYIKMLQYILGFKDVFPLDIDDNSSFRGASLMFLKWETKRHR